MKTNKGRAWFFSATHQDNPIRDMLKHRVLLNRTLSSKEALAATILQADKYGQVHSYELSSMTALIKEATLFPEARHKCIISFQTYEKDGAEFRVAVAKLRAANHKQDKQNI